MTYEINNLFDLEKLACQLFDKIRDGIVVMLRGELGVGKTTLSSYILRKLVGGDGDFTSPTFNIVNEYYSELRKCKVFHLDLYRIKNFDELYDIGLNDMLGNGIVLIEWPEIAFPMLKKIDSNSLMMINLSFVNEDIRSCAVEIPCNIDEKEVEYQEKVCV